MMLWERIQIVRTMSQAELLLLRQDMNPTRALWPTVAHRLRPMSPERAPTDFDRKAHAVRLRNLQKQEHARTGRST